MMKTVIVQQTTPRACADQALRRGRLSRVWIETRNPRQPLVGVWIDEAMRSLEPVFASDAMDREVSLLCA